MTSTLYYSTRFLAQGGQSLYLAAMLIAAGTSSSAALGVTSVMGATMVGAIVCGLPAGALSDRLGPGRAYSLGAIGRLAAIASAVALVGKPEVAWIAAFAYSSFSQLYSPSELSLARVINRESLARTHTLLVGLQYAAQATGLLALAPLMFAVGGARAALLAAAGVYVVVTLLTIVLGLRVRGTEATAEAPSREAFSLRQTLSFLSGEPQAAYAVGLLSFMDMATKVIVIAVPVYLLHDLGLTRTAMVAVLLPGVAGAALGLAWVWRSFALEEAPRVMRMALFGTVASVLALAALDRGFGLAEQVATATILPNPNLAPNSSVLVVLPVALLLGISFVIAPICARAVLSATAPRGQQARVFATQSTLTEMLVILPFLLAGAGTEFAGPRATFGFVALVGIAAIMLLEAVASRPAVSEPVPALAEATVY